VHKKGIGRELSEKLFEIALQRNIHTIIAFIGGGSENVASINLHTKLGFELVGNIRDAGFKFERWVDVSIMQKVL